MSSAATDLPGPAGAEYAQEGGQPFTRFQGSAGHGELEEEPRGRGLRYRAAEQRS
jgi:hypothetical protein